MKNLGLPAGWREEELGSFCRVVSGGTPSRAHPEYFQGVVPWVKISDMNKWIISDTEEKISQFGLENSAAKIFPKGTILVSIFATIGSVAILDIDAATNQAIAGIIPDSQVVERNYLAHYLSYHRPMLEAMSRGVAQRNINQKILKSIRVVLPPLEVQSAIADILDGARALRQKREQANQMTNKILQTIFQQMFGDPVANPKEWKLVSFGALIKESKNGLSRRRKPEEKGGYVVLRIQDIQKGGIDTEDLNRIPMIDTEFEKYRLLPSDILFVRVNGNIELVGKVALFDLESNEMAFNDHIVRLRVNSEVEPIFLKHFLETKYARTEIKKRAVTSAGQFSVGQQRLATMSVPIPPLSLQRQFGLMVQKLKFLRKNQARSTQTINQLFDSLMSRAFKGELVTEVN